MSTEAIIATLEEQDPDKVLPNGMTVRHWKEVLTRIVEKNKNPEYRAFLDRAFEGAAQIRRERNAEELRWLEEAEGK
ncbi:MAG: hypothetical protein H7Y38_05380 [Armatimonadetes bacterium]|nr:hypothetical protein [Armatimonadota bacterium]